MEDLDRILCHIEYLRKKLTDLIQVSESLVDPEIVKTSKLLDAVLNEYHYMQHSSFPENKKTTLFIPENRLLNKAVVGK